MSFVELFLIGVGLSMDAFAVAVAKGLALKRVNMRYALIVAPFFGGFQAIMPLAGWALGNQFANFVTPIDHWIAFGLLVFVGAKMLKGAFHKDEEQIANQDRLEIKELLMLSVATSIDAFAVGIGFAFLQVNIVSAIIIIGLTTFVLSLIGVLVGNRFGARYKRKATIVGGIVLVALGFKILLEHLGILAF